MTAVVLAMTRKFPLQKDYDQFDVIPVAEKVLHPVHTRHLVTEGVARRMEIEEDYHEQHCEARQWKVQV